MAAPETSSRSVFLHKLRALPGFRPLLPSTTRLLKLPSRGVVEHADDYLYFVVPTEAYDAKHLDPFEVFDGQAIDTYEWAKLVFGVRYKGMHLYTLLIDKKRRVAVCTRLIGYLPDLEMDWSDLERGLGQALAEAHWTKSTDPLRRCDHIMVTPWCGLQYVDLLEEAAWGRDDYWG